MGHEIVSEKMGGDSPLINVSAKTKEGLDLLLENNFVASRNARVKSQPK